MTGFAESIRAFHGKTEARMDQIVRKVCMDVTADIVRLTPVDTGMARSNWFVGNDRVTSVETSPTKNGSASNKRASDFASTLHAGGVFYITNNLPYIMALEFGAGPNQFGHGSIQAPAGMARVTCSKWQARLDRLARSL